MTDEERVEVVEAIPCATSIGSAIILALNIFCRQGVHDCSGFLLGFHVPFVALKLCSVLHEWNFSRVCTSGNVSMLGGMVL